MTREKSDNTNAPDAPATGNATHTTNTTSHEARSAPVRTYRRQLEPKNGRITKKLAAAIEIMVSDGLTFEKAATLAGMKPASLQRALRKPHVKRHLEEKKRALIENFADNKRYNAVRAYNVAVELMDTATSEAIRLKAMEFVARVGNINPAERKEITHDARIAGSDYGYLPPGSRIIEIAHDNASRGDEGQAPDIIDVTPND